MCYFLIPDIIVGKRQYLIVELISSFHTIRLLYVFRELQTPNFWTPLKLGYRFHAELSQFFMYLF